MPKTYLTFISDTYAPGQLGHLAHDMPLVLCIGKTTHGIVKWEEILKLLTDSAHCLHHSTTTTSTTTTTTTTSTGNQDSTVSKSLPVSRNTRTNFVFLAHQTSSNHPLPKAKQTHTKKTITENPRCKPRKVQWHQEWTKAVQPYYQLSKRRWSHWAIPPMMGVVNSPLIRPAMAFSGHPWISMIHLESRG